MSLSVPSALYAPGTLPPLNAKPFLSCDNTVIELETVGVPSIPPTTGTAFIV